MLHGFITLPCAALDFLVLCEENRIECFVMSATGNSMHTVFNSDGFVSLVNLASPDQSYSAPSLVVGVFRRRTGTFCAQV